LGSSFATPEEMILNQFDPSEEMFFISSGDCTVNIKDNNRREVVGHRLLVEGDHFGEIGLIYDCARTASIQSRNYNTMATISK
jgi:CRP-like cAMP-binding protein